MSSETDTRQPKFLSKQINGVVVSFLQVMAKETTTPLIFSKEIQTRVQQQPM